MEILTIDQGNIQIQSSTESRSNVVILFSPMEIQSAIVQDISDLVSQAAQGSHAAYAALYQRYVPGIRKFLNYMGHTDKYLQDDIIQDIFFILWSKRQRLGEVRNFEAYLFMMARNILLNYLRKTKRHSTSPVQVESLEHISDCNTLESIDRREIRKIYYKGIHLLPRQTKKVCLLNEDGMKIKEIARTLGISPNTVKNHRQLAVRKLREWLFDHIN
jgi:RNA polymerase sigma-70 factor (family 1)